MDGINLVKRVKERRVSGHAKRGRPKTIMRWGGERGYEERLVHQRIWKRMRMDINEDMNEVVKEDMKEDIKSGW